MGRGSAQGRLVVFLDFDGVLNRGSGPGVPALVEQLNRITDLTRAEIVVSSSWRYDRTLEQLTDILRSWGVTGLVTGVCKSPSMFARTASGIIVPDGGWAAFTEGMPSTRDKAVAIQHWLNDHPDIKRYAILEDHADDLGHLRSSPSVFLTSMRVGLTKEVADRVICHLKRVTW